MAPTCFFFFRLYFSSHTALWSSSPPPSVERLPADAAAVLLHVAARFTQQRPSGFTHNGRVCVCVREGLCVFWHKTHSLSLSRWTDSEKDRNTGRFNDQESQVTHVKVKKGQKVRKINAEASNRSGHIPSKNVMSWSRRCVLLALKRLFCKKKGNSVKSLSNRDVTMHREPVKNRYRCVKIKIG